MTSRRVLRVVAPLTVLGAIGAVAAVAAFVSAPAAVVALAGVLAVAGLLRAVAPTSVLPCARSRPFDVVFLLALAAALGYLSTWADATVPAG